MATKRKNEVTKNVDTNSVTISGIVKKVNYIGEKMASYNVDIRGVSPKGNTVHAWVDVVDFVREIDLAVDDVANISGSLMTQTYEKNGNKVYKVVVKAETIDVDDLSFD